MRSLLLLTFLFVSICSNGQKPLKGKIDPLFNYLDSCVWSKMDEGDYVLAEKRGRAALSYTSKLNSPFALARAYNTLGTVLLYKGQFPEALKNLFAALRIREDINDRPGIANTYNNIASVYYDQHNYDDALKMYKKSLEYLDGPGSERGISAIANNIGLIYADKDQPSEALKYYMKSFTIDSSLGLKEGVALSYLNVGRAYSDLGKFELAKQSFDKGLELAKQIDDSYIIGKMLINSTAVDLHYKDFDIAKKKIEEALKLSLSNENPDEIKEAYAARHLLDSAQNNLSSAYTSYKEYIRYKDIVSNKENDQRTTEARIQYEYDKKESMLRTEMEKRALINKQERKNQLLVRNAFIAGFLLVLVLAGVTYRGYNIKRKANIEISRQKNEVTEQKELVEEKNREIVDSINYAKRLQHAILPPLALIRKRFPQTFVFYRPKDIVAGDFYFFEETKDSLIIAVADCTGHGVPGAILSVVASNALSRAVKEFALTDPGKILDKVSDLVIETFERSENQVSDGMDISMLVIRKTNEDHDVKALWAGANNPLWIIRGAGGSIEELKADKQPIGKFENRRSFTTHELILAKGDTVYLFSDGYPDQFGGEKGKKFKYSQLKTMLEKITVLPVDKQEAAIEKTFEGWKGVYDQTDDVTLAGIRL
jgi:serine phosphatase RsbU (regulator of sigma subunit)